MAAFELASAACNWARACETRAEISSRSSSTSTCPAFTRSPASTCRRFTIPLALDFTSTRVIGSTLPVATTLFAKSCRSTLASLDGSIFVPPLVTAYRATPQRSNAPTPMPPQSSQLRFFLPFPFATRTSRRKPGLPGSCETLRSLPTVCSGIVALDRRPTGTTVAAG
jgi:hypothetical protein